MRWQALLAALPVSAAAVVLLELTRLPASVLVPDRLLAASGQLVRSAATSFALPLALLLVSVAILAGGSRPPVRVAGLAAVGILQVVFAREGLIEYSPFAHSVALNVGFVLLGLGSAALHGWLARASAGAGTLGLTLGLIIGIASLLAARMHYAVYVGLYPTLHQCVLQMGFVGSALGTALVLEALDTPRRGSLKAAAGLTVGLIAVAWIEAPAAAWAGPVVTAYTELGRGAGVAAALAREGEFLRPVNLPPPRRSRLLAPDRDAEARFARSSGLPPLGGSLSERDVLLVIADATRYDRTSLADPRLRTTPRLRSLVRRGAHWHTRAYAPSNGTFPSLASMFSMRPLSFAEVDLQPRYWRGTLREGRPTAPELLAAEGRRTFWVGHDHEHCFSAHARGLERGFERRVLVEELRDAPSPDIDDEIAARAIRVLEQTSGRFFGLVFFVSPHNPYLGGYEAELRRFDAALGRLLDAVDLTRTIVIVAGDHGEAFGEHEHRFHLSSVYDEQVHVPLVTWIPGEPGGRHEAPTSTAYVLPWLLLRGTDAQQRAVRALLREDVGPWMRALDGAVVSEMVGPSRQAASLAWADTTVVYDVLADLPRLFDGLADPGQRHDLRESNVARVERVLPWLRNYRRARYEGRRFRFVGAAR